MNKSLLFFILLIGFILRFYNLNNYPVLNADEAAIGYNAYSLLKTGADEHGNSWPIHFQSFNDFKPGLYFYLVLPFVYLLGLSEWAVRIPGALLGVLTIPVLYLLVRELFPKNKWLPVVSALFLTISPWHIHFSRGGWEVNAATFFITLGVYCFYKGKTHKKWLTFAVLAFIVSLYTYHAARIIVPLLCIGLLALNRKQFFLNIKRFLLPFGIGSLLAIPLILDISQGGLSRAAGVGIFADPGPFNKTNEQRGEHIVLESVISKLYHNKMTNYSLAFFQNYTDHFSGDFLFLSGDEIQRSKVPDVGQLYFLDLIFIISAFFAIAKNLQGWVPVLLWLFLAPVAAALTFQSPHALRSQNMVIPITIISAYGAIVIINWINSNIKYKALAFVLCSLFYVLMFWDFTRYLHQYYVHMAQTYDYSSQYGVKELVQYVAENEKKYERVVVTDRYDQPYILFLFYLKYPPKDFQAQHVLTSRDEFGFSTVRDFGKYTFVAIAPWDKITNDYPHALVAGTSEEIPEAANILKTVYFPSGRVAFKVVGN